MILYRFMSETEINDSRDLAKFLGVQHKKVMDFYRELDNYTVDNRRFIECTLVHDSNKIYLRDMCDSLVFVIARQFMDVKQICL